MSADSSPNTGGMLQLTGGARIGWVNATWPFARFEASPQRISLSGWLLGSYAFAPGEIAALEPHGYIPLLGRGVRIVHTNPRYPETIVFWCPGSPERLALRIRDLGFHPAASLSSVPKREGMPLQPAFVAALILAWAALLLFDRAAPWPNQRGLGPQHLFALLLVFLGAVAADRSEACQRFMLKPGRFVTEIRPALRLLQLVSAIVLVGLTIVVLRG